MLFGCWKIHTHEQLKTQHLIWLDIFEELLNIFSHWATNDVIEDLTRAL